MYMLIRGADICMYSCPRASRRPQRVYVRGRQPRAEQLLHLQGGNGERTEPHFVNTTWDESIYCKCVYVLVLHARGGH